MPTPKPERPREPERTIEPRSTIETKSTGATKSTIETKSTGEPQCETIVTPYGGGEHYGAYTFEDMAHADLLPLAKLTGGEIVQAGSLLFLDTETTGLAAGAGVVAFLVGVGHFTDDGFIVKQYFMRDFDEEPALLSLVASEMTRRRHLVTYNGKAFDANLMQGRFLMNRRRMPEPHSHIDLLHSARRIWKDSLPNCRLSTVEEAILGEPRAGDIPGSEIPGVYYRFLQDGWRGKINAVLLHNRRDILAMASLLRYLCGALRATGSAAREAALPIIGHGAGGADRPERRFAFTARELLGIATLHQSLGNHAAAGRCLRLCTRGAAQPPRALPGASAALPHAAPAPHVSATQRKALGRLAEMHRKAGEYKEAAACWETLVASGPSRDAAWVTPYVELSKYYEHRARDCQKALLYVREAIAIASSARRCVQGQDLEKRRARIEGKIARGARPADGGG